MSERKSTDQYENDITRLEERTFLVLESFYGAPEFDQELLEEAWGYANTVFDILTEAIGRRRA